ncbi:MAG: hypothetical protein HY828_13555 [Actinobacteria bacterium]|nr:hypothetical protein [Actinomycetota bacterium]
MLLRRVTLLFFAAVLVSACGAAASSASDPEPTVPVGDLPAVVTTPDSAEPAPPDSTVVGTTSTLPQQQTVGALAKGNRVILLGDSVLASTSRRYGNNMCEALVPLGWQVEVNAETSRPVQFGNTVLDKRLSAGWDVGVVLLGNNYGGDQDEYRRQLEKIVTRLSPGPVVLLTVSEFTESRVEVNDVIREMADKYDNVHLVQWAQVTADRPDFTGADGLHLTEIGREGLAANVAFALGHAPTTPGKCLTSSYTNDSGGPVTGTTLKPGSTPTTTKKPSGSTTTTDGGSGGSTTSTGGSDPTVTATSKPPTSTPTTTAAPPESSVASGGPVPGDTTPPVVP